MVFGSREMVSGHRSMVLPGSDMPSALGLVSFVFTLFTFKGSSLCLLYLIVPFGTVNNNKFG